MVKLKIPKAEFMALSDEKKYQLAQKLADQVVETAEKFAEQTVGFVKRMEKSLKKLS